MTKRYWISGTLGDWSTGSIWVLGAIPRPMDDPVINTLSSVTVSGITAVHSVTMNTAPIFEASNAQSSSMVEPTPVSPAAIDPVTPASAPVVDHFLLWGTDSELVGYFSPASDNVSVVMNSIASAASPNLLSDAGLSSDNMTTMDRPTIMTLDDPNLALHRTGDDSQASGTVEANGSGSWSDTPTGLSDENASTPTNVFSNTAPQPASLSLTVVISPSAATESIVVGTGSSAEQSAGNSSPTGFGNQNATSNFMADGSQSSGPHSATIPTSLLSFVGFDYFAENTNSFLIPSSQVAITTLANMGTNTIALNLTLYEQTTTSNVVTNDSQYGGSSAGLSAAVEYAHSLGLKVAFSPNILALTGYSDPTNKWQGEIQPTDPAAWFASYTQVLVQYATIAQNDHVDLFILGSELSWLDSQPQFLPYWTELIAAVRSVYTGPITYGASFIGDWEPQPWISTPNYPESVTFWNQLNYLGVDLNPNLTTNPGDNATAFANAWYSDAAGHNIIAYLESLSSTFGKNILITALGGFYSYLGSNEDLTGNIPQNAVPDNLQQELLYNSAYAALTQANTGWLSGILQWQEDPYPANGLNGIETANNTPTGDGVFGKPAQYLLAAWYGAKDYLSWSDTSFLGSILNDQICLYGNQYVPTQGHPNPTTTAQTFATTISVTFGGNILNGHVATLELSANGNDLGSFTLNSADVGNYVDQNGISYTNDETFIATIPGLTNISQLKVSFVSPVDLGSVETSNAFISNLSINGISLSGVTYLAGDGTTSQKLIDGHNSDSNAALSGGYMLVDPTPWNLQVTNNEAGTITQPIQVDGGGGIDTVYVLGVPADYQINEVNANTVTLTENSGLDQNAVLTDISYIVFQNEAIFNVSADTFVTTVQQEIDALYVTLYGLAATQAGINYWTNVVSAYDSSITAGNAGSTPISAADEVYLGQQMTAGSPVVNGTTYFQTVYPSTMTDLAYVQALYQNMSGFIGTVAGDQYWLNVLQQAEAGNGGNITLAREAIVGQFAHDFYSNNLTVGATALGVSASDYALLVAGQQTLLNKATVAQYWATETGVTGGGILNFTSVTDPSFAAAQHVLAGITSDPSTVTVAITGIAAAVAQQNLSLA